MNIIGFGPTSAFLASMSATESVQTFGRKVSYSLTSSRRHASWVLRFLLAKLDSTAMHRRSKCALHTWCRAPWLDFLPRSSEQKTAIAVSYCKRGRGIIKINGCPIELVEPETLRYKVHVVPRRLMPLAT